MHCTYMAQTIQAIVLMVLVMVCICFLILVLITETVKNWVEYLEDFLQVVYNSRYDPEVSVGCQIIQE